MTDYIKRNEEDIRQSLEHDVFDVNACDLKKEKAKKYERFILLFVKLFCNPKIEKSECIGDWLSKSYFPAEECLAICERFGELHGQAILKQRMA